LFSIVGIGASAGGLEALEQFLGHVPADSGMAYVIVQHLDPTRKGIMPAQIIA
jgi:two-component system CheB/CheR fusion protein